MSLRFCMLTTFYPPFNFGGDGIGIERLCHGLLRRGHEVTVVLDEDAWRNLAPGREPAEKVHPPGLEVIRLKARFGKVSNLLTQQLGRPVVHGRRIARILAEGSGARRGSGGSAASGQPFDVINFHNVSLVGGPGLFKYGDAIKLYMAHEHWLVCPSHVLWRHGRELCDARECLRCVLHYRRPPQGWRYTGFLEREARHIDAFIAMSEFSRAKHKEFGFPRDMEVVNYFLPDPASAASPTATDGSSPSGSAAADASPHPRPYFLFVGRLERIKGLDDVIPLFKSRFQDADLVIAGDGDHGPALRQLAQGIERVKFLGRVPSEQLARWYRHSLALLVPSVCFETFGIILIEAFEQRTAVIARRLGPFPEIVEKARAGELFSNDDELLVAMKRLQADATLRAEYGRRGHQAYLDHWCESAVLPKYLDVVRRAAQRKGRHELLARMDGAT
jgi:glycosyltransferase involved in cell wall biosynthesis